ncbi:MAG TPA: CsgG/HfaB family protein, partial [Gemmataceae bacterium]|nr:CsgG/HfaB family protein [Gemmataceae bacterium]
MRRTCCVALLLANLVFSLLLGCGQQNGGGDNNHGAQPQPVVAPVASIKNGDPLQGTPVPKPGDPVDVWKDINFTPPDANQERYDAAMMDAIDLLAQKKYAEALACMEAASKFKDTELVQTEMKKLRLRIDQQQAADSTLHDIQTLFDQGQFAEAGLLATDALKEYGSTDSAPDLVKLKLQADALTVSGQADNNAKHKSFRDQGQAAMGAGNFRAAVLAFEQALQFADDAGLRKTCDDLRAKLTKYDDNRAQAAELRKNAVNLEEALTLLQDAAKEWDTPQIKQDIDEYTLALQNRRDRIAIADFEVRGDIGIPMADRVIAEELLPYFKGRFDIVERGQFAKVLDELKLEGGTFGTDQDRQEFGKLAKVRYLVLGSVSRFGGTSVNARLVDVQTGLVVQTAKITAASPEDLLAHLPDLAKMLLMSDQEQFAYQAELAKQAPQIPQVQVDQPLPPPPELPGPGQPVPPPEILDTKLPPNFGGAKPADIGGFQPLPEGQPLPPIVYGGEPEEVWKRKALYVSVYMGDTLYRRGRPAAALRYFDFGLTLAPGFLEIDFRITKVRPLLPPPPVIIVVPSPPPPRIAIIDLVVVGDPLVVDPGLSWWTARAMAPYFSPPYEVVDPGEVYWWMARMGMTVRDLMVDPYARRWLGRALNIRYFVFGVVTQTASFNVDTSMVDAEYGYLQGRGFVHVNNSFELRYRVGELARMTQSAPGLLPQQQKVFVTYEGLIGKARLAANGGDLKIA